VSARFTEADALAVSRLVAAVRAAPEFNVLAFESMVDRVRALVYQRLWRLLVRDAGALIHARALRDYLLLGRGDLFQAFLEQAAPMMVAVAATSPHAVHQLAAGPWDAAAAAARLKSEWSMPGSDSTVGDSDAADPCFGLLQLSILHRALRFDAPPPVRLGTAADFDGDGCADDDDGERSVRSAVSSISGGIPSPLASLLRGRRGAARGAGSVTGGARPSTAASPGPGHLPLSCRAWTPATAAPAEAVSRMPRVAAALTLVCAAAPVEYGLLPAAPLPAAVASPATAGASGPEALITKLLLSAPPPLPPSPLLPSGATLSDQRSVGAVWFTQPVVVSRGFLMRASLDLCVPLREDGEEAAPAGTTTSCAFVIQRERALAAGRHSGEGRLVRMGGVPSAGYDGIRNSLVVHLLCKRLPGTTAGRQQSPATFSPGAASSPGAAGADSVAASSATYRIVVAVYGPPSARGERALLGSAVLLEHTLPRAATMQRATLGAASPASLVAAYRLHIAVEYVPPGAPSLPAGSRGGRLRVCALDVSAALAGSGPPDADADAVHRRRTSVASTRSAMSSAAGTATAGGAGAGAGAGGTSTRTIVEAAITLEEQLNFTGWHGPGAGRAWLGFTADAAGPVAVALEHADAVSYADADDGYGGLQLDYAVPWPLHLVFTAGALTVYQDMFRLLLRVRAVSMALQDAWRFLMAEYSHGAAAAAAAAGAGTAAASAGWVAGGGGAGGAARAPAAAGPVVVAGALAASGPSAPAAAASAQVSGAGGKRSADPAAHRRLRARIAIHKLLQPVWLLRARMAYVVDGVQAYLQLDVVQSGFSALCAAVASAHDFAALKAAHHAFLAHLSSAGFIGQPSVAAMIARVLGHCERFIGLLAAHRADLAGLLRPDGSRGALEAVDAGFAADLRLLAGGAGAATATADGVGLGSLLARLNFNGYFGE
jgi:hypothetical protein